MSVLASLKKPAAQAQFAFVGDQKELQRVIDAGDFGAWRVFLHPDQRRFVDRPTSGPTRLGGGAGTGKTVVLLHRARVLARRNPGSRILLTTYTRNLAASLRDNLTQLDPSIPVAARLGDPGVFVVGIDALAAAVLREARSGLPEAVTEVLGEPRTEMSPQGGAKIWRAVIQDAPATLPPELRNETFVSAEYATVVVPQRITTEKDYLRARRRGRGVALDRARRAAVWQLVSAYRAQHRVAGTVDFTEAAGIAAAVLERSSDRRADHVLVDEGQDLQPTHWQVLRAIVAEGPDDLFVAEDSHQRIYGTKVVLGHHGIKVVGRSHRLTLNYRTTAQNLRYAMSILEGGTYVDLDDEPEETGYRSARVGPSPKVLVGVVDHGPPGQDGRTGRSVVGRAVDSA